MDVVAPVAAAAADITDERTVTKAAAAMTPRIDELMPCIAGGGDVEPADVVKNASAGDPQIHNNNMDIGVDNKSAALPANNNNNSGDDEKCDGDPENSRKSCDVTPDTADEVSLIENLNLDGAASNEGSPREESATKQPGDTNGESTAAELSKPAMAFTIDFNDGKQVDDKKYKDIFERFQKRHRRGASMSKLEDHPTNGNSVKTKPPLKKGASNPPRTPTIGDSPNAVSLDETISVHTPVVAMRDKSRLSRKDVSLPDNRHSWSPRNSLQTNNNYDGEFEAPKVKLNVDKPVPTKPKTFQPKSETLQRAFESIKTKGMPSRSTVPKPLSQEDIVMCEVPPLEYRPDSSNGSISSVSEAGTYTLDGDNYTEEQKEQMSIDKMAKLSQGASATMSASTRIDAEPEHPFEKPKTKTSYLDRIKSKVKNISDRTFHKNRSPETNEVSYRQLTYQPSSNSLDLGNFTSVTSAGVFSKHTIQEQITPKVRVPRKSSLTKSQIDSSEYIQKMDSFTDYEKARHNDYQLNIFSGHLESESIQGDTALARNCDDSFGIERAETKNDWIQEWAKNARRNTKKKSNPSANENHRQHSNAQYDTSQATSSSDFSDVNSHARMPSSSRRNEIAFNDSGIYTDNMHRFEMRSAAGRQPPPPSHHEQYQHQHLSSARNGSGRRGSMNNAYQLRSNHSEFGDDMDDDQSTGSSMQQQQPSSLMLDAEHRGRRDFYHFASSNAATRPPLSPTKIPSPMHSLSRPRSSSVNRSIHSSITDLDMHNDDTGMYLHKTAAAISQLQSIHRNHNSPQSPSSPQRQPPTNKIASNFMTSPSIRRHYKTSPFATKPTTDHPLPHPPLYSSSASLHKRNHSLDLPDDHPAAQREQMFNSYNSDGLNALLNLKFPHSRHNSYEDKPSPVRSVGGGSSHKTIDQTFAPQIVQRGAISTPTAQHKPNKLAGSTPTSTAPSRTDASKVRSKSVNVTPTTIKRSSSFSTKPFVRPSSGNKIMTPRMEARTTNTTSGLQKSASSTSFKNMSSKHEAANIYLNQNDDLYANDFSSESELSEPGPDTNEKELLTNTRYNKAFLARLEQNKQKCNSGPAQLKQGMAACPNTPELPRRDIRVRQSLRDRASMPRDSSINRMKQDLTTSITVAKKQLTESPVAANSRSASSGGSARVLPKYLDISKYKPTQGNTFLKRDESKSTLNPQHKEIKRSNSSFGVGMQKSEAGRSSVRSAKSATNSRPTMSASKDDATREADLSMWRRRASYDPMKAAAEGKRKLEEKKITHASKYNESSSAVLRSKSYHSGVGQSAAPADSPESGSKRWTLISTGSSDEEFAEGY